jgi:exodeoxyribonuclease V beta subunit
VKSLDPLAVPLQGMRLIEASAGTGKTYTITTLYVRLLLERELPVGQILVVTYTNAATAELRDRIRRRLRAALELLEADDAGGGGDDALRALLERRRAGRDADRRRLTAAIHGFDDAAIFTIHGFCQRVLQENAFESGVSFDVRLVTDQTPLRDEIASDFWARELYGAPEELARYLPVCKVTLERICGLAAKAIANPHVAFLPARPDPPARGALDDEIERWRRAHAAAAEIWGAERDAIIELLCCGDALKKTGYHPDAICSSDVPELDQFLVPGVPAGTACDFVAKLTTAALREGTKKNRETPRHRFFVACNQLHAAQQALEARLRDRLVELQLDLVDYARRESRRRAGEADTQSFDDLLHRLDEALAGPAGAALAERIRGRYRAALIDEFQDTDPVQYRIFERLYRGGEGGLFVIGDPKQAIYAFRGADVFAYMQAKRDAAKPVYTLDTNRRSGPRLLRAINSIFALGGDLAPFVFPEIPFTPMRPAPAAADVLGGSAAGRPPLQILFVRRPPGEKRINKGWADDNLARLVAAEIARFLASGATIEGRDVVPGDVAVLCRKNKQAARVQEELRRLAIPSVLQGDASVFDSPECRELERVLGAMAEPTDPAALGAALVTPLCGLGGADLFALRENEADWDDWVRRFQEWSEVWRASGFMPAFRRMLDGCDAPARLLGLVDGERRLTNVLHLGELLQTAAAETRRGPLGLIEWLAEMRVDAGARGEMAGEAAQMRLESDGDALKLTTVHKSKGLEYPIVYCPFLWDGKLLYGEDCLRFHTPDGALAMDLSTPPLETHRRLAEREALAESLRLLYVALTRAKHRCSIVWGAFRDAETSALGYVLHQPPSRPEGQSAEGAAKDHIRSLDDAAMRAELRALADSSGGSIEVELLADEMGPKWTRAAASAAELRCRTMTREVKLTWRTSSFSGLAAAGGAGSPAEEGRDRDEIAEEMTPGGGAAAGETVVLHELPSGAGPGQMMHELLERLDFPSAEGEVLASAVERALRRYGMDPVWAEPLRRAVADFLDTPLDRGAEPLRLRLVGTERRLSELQFTFPVRGDGKGALTSRELADVLARHGRPPLPAEYARRLRGLGFAALAGYLTGFVDLVFEHGGRWYLVDYKSNLLGARPRDYGAGRLIEAMARHHYFLQYHLYTVAVHRYLSLRLDGYDYERDFGGVYYLFLRGMAPSHPFGCGVFRDVPPRALIDDLSAALAGGAAVEERT